MHLLKKVSLFCTCAVLLLACPAMADTSWPTKPVTLMVSNSVGGMVDVTSRILADGMLKILGQPLVIQNKPGAGGQICLRYVARSQPDGYTVFSGNITTPLAATELAGKNLLNLDDYEFVGGFLPNERALYIHADAPFKTWEEFVAYAKAHPDTLSIGFGGNQWSYELMKYVTAKAGIQCKLINYKSGGDASADFFGRHIDIVELGVGTPVYQAALEGKARMLIVTSGNQIPHFDAPRLLDKGYPYPILSEFGLLMPKGTPQEIIGKMEAALETVLKDPETLKKMHTLGAQARFISGKDLKARSLEVRKGIREMKADQK